VGKKGILECNTELSMAFIPSSKNKEDPQTLTVLTTFTFYETTFVLVYFKSKQESA
jgi:hypothetical protein